MKTLQALRKPLFYLAATAMVLFGVMAIYYSTVLGPWTMVDTVDYFDVARNFSQLRGLVVTRGSGIFRPMTVHPPFYSIVLAPAVLLQLDLLSYVRGLDLLLFAVFSWSILRSTFQLTSSALLTLGIGLWIVTDRAILRNFTAALSEPLYLTLGVLSLSLLYEFINRGKRSLLYLGALLAGLSLLTRYSGAAFLVAGFMIIFIWRINTWGERIKELVVYALIACSPVLLWLASLRWLYPGNTPGRLEGGVNVWQAMTPFRLTFVQGLWDWLGLIKIFQIEDYRLQMIVLVLLFTALGILVFLALRKSTQRPATQSTLLIGSTWVWFTLASIAILLFSYLFIEIPKPWLDERLYSPVQLGLILSCIYMLYLGFRRLTPKWYASLPALAFILLVAGANTPQTLGYAQSLHQTGEGYTSIFWQRSDFTEALQTIPPNRPIVSNDPGAVLFFYGEPAIDLVHAVEKSEYNQIPPAVEEKDAVVIIFERKLNHQLLARYGNKVDAYIEKLTKDLQAQYTGKDFTIYYNP
jgi:hypothetical protein